MFSSRFYFLLSFYMSCVKYCNVSPIYYDRSKEKFSYKTKGLTGIHITNWLFLQWSVAFSYKTYQFRKARDLDNFNLCLACGLLSIITIIAKSVLNILYADCVSLLNAMFQFVELICRKFMPRFDRNKSKYNLLCEVLLVLSVGAAGAAYLLMMLLLLHDPCGLFFLGSLIPPEKFTFPVRIVLTLYHAYMVLVSVVATNMFCVAVVVYAFYLTPFYLRELRLGRAKYLTDNRLRNIINIQVMFRAFQILHDQALSIFGLLIVIVNGYMMYTIIFCSAVLMRYWSELLPLSRAFLLLMCFAFLGFWLFVLELGRYFFVQGGQTLRSWKVHKWGSRNKEMMRFHRSCRPILICCGTKFVIRRATGLIFLRGVVRGTFRTMLLLAKK